MSFIRGSTIVATGVLHVTTCCMFQCLVYLRFTEYWRQWSTIERVVGGPLEVVHVAGAGAWNCL